MQVCPVCDSFVCSPHVKRTAKKHPRRKDGNVASAELPERKVGHAHGLLQCRARGCGITWDRDRVGFLNIARIVEAAILGAPRPVCLSRCPARPSVGSLHRRM